MCVIEKFFWFYLGVRIILFYLKSNNNLNWCVMEYNINVYYKLWYI